jgi:hypothetical protein
MGVPTKYMRDCARSSGDVCYLPFITSDGCVGYHIMRDKVPLGFVYLNPSDNSDGESGEDIFVYRGTVGNPAEDAPVCFIGTGVRQDYQLRTYTVIGVYEDAKYDEGRFAETFVTSSAEEAEQAAHRWAAEQNGEEDPGIIIAGVVAGAVSLADAV